MPNLSWYFSAFSCPDPLTVSEWAEQKRVVSTSVSPEGGKWSNERYPYQKGVMDALSDPYVEEVVWVSSTQVGKTSLGENFLGWIIDQDPGPTLVVMDNQDMAEDFSSNRFRSMVRDTPCLRPKFKETRGRQERDNSEVNKVKIKSFPGGRVKFVGANATGDLASMPARYVYADEVDRWAIAAGEEGDQIELIKRRTDRFWNRKLLYSSTPGTRESSRINFLYESSDQRKFFVPCPHCDTFQVLQWKNLKWDKKNEAHIPETAHFVCGKCKGKIEQQHARAMIARGEWRATAKPTSQKLVGFWIWAAYARPWAAIVEDFLAAKKKGREGIKAFTNTVLGEVWEEKGQAPEWKVLKDRAEQYAPWTIPHSVGFLTFGADVQDDRIEASVWGWGKGEESWLIGHTVLWGDPAGQEVWKQLDALVASSWEQPSRELRLSCLLGCIDSGHKTNEVYLYVMSRPQIYAIKGASLQTAPTVGTPSYQDVDHKGQKIKDGVMVWPLGVHSIKVTLYGRFGLVDPGPGHVHFPSGVDDSYYLQLTAEELKTKYHKGFPVREFHQKRERNEALDCAVYAYAAARIAGIQRLDWSQLHAPQERPPQPVNQIPATQAQQQPYVSRMMQSLRQEKYTW